MFSRILITILLLFGTSGNNKTVEGVLPEHNSKVPNSVPIISPDDTLVPANYSRKATEQEDKQDKHKNSEIPSLHGSIPIDEAHFPDANFRASLTFYDEEDDGILTLAEREWVKDIYASSSTSLKGIEYFPNIISLDCGYGKLTSIDLSNNTALRYIDCSNNKLAHINLGNNENLRTLNCSNNLLTTLEVRGCPSLTYLDCSYNGLTILDVSKNTLLEALDCNNNCLLELNAGQCSALRQLCCRENSLVELNIDNCTSLQNLDCGENSLTKINLSNKLALKSLYCKDNNIATLDLSNCQSLILQPYEITTI